MSIIISGIKFFKNSTLSQNNTYISKCKKFFLKNFNTKYGAQKEYEILCRLKNNDSFVQPLEYIVLNSNHFIIYPYLNNSCQVGSKSYYLKDLNQNKLFYKICKSIKLLHNQNIAHLDIKPANILVQNNSPKIIDFEFAEDLTNLNKTRKRKGTRCCVSPEMINYYLISKHCDMWSLGVVYYTMKNYDYPFKDERIIKANKVKDIIPPRYMNSIEKDLLYLMLNDDYKTRSNINEVISFMECNLNV